MALVVVAEDEVGAREVCEFERELGERVGSEPVPGAEPQHEPPGCEPERFVGRLHGNNARPTPRNQSDHPFRVRRGRIPGHDQGLPVLVDLLVERVERVCEPGQILRLDTHEHREFQVCPFVLGEAADHVPSRLERPAVDREPRLVLIDRRQRRRSNPDASADETVAPARDLPQLALDEQSQCRSAGLKQTGETGAHFAVTGKARAKSPDAARSTKIRAFLDRGFTSGVRLLPE